MTRFVAVLSLMTIISVSTSSQVGFRPGPSSCRMPEPGTRSSAFTVTRSRRSRRPDCASWSACTSRGTLIVLAAGKTQPEFNAYSSLPVRSVTSSPTSPTYPRDRSSV